MLYLNQPQVGNFFQSGQFDDGGFAPPVARIDFLSTPDGVAPHQVGFSASRSTSEAGIREYLWDMGDGTFYDTPEVSHTFLTPGAKTVTLMVVDVEDQTGRTEVRFDVSGNLVPIARIDYTQAGLQFVFRAASSSDPDGNLVDFNWVINGVAFTGATVPWTAPSAGQFLVTLTVGDDGVPQAMDSESAVVLAVNDVNPTGDVETVQDRLATLGLEWGTARNMDAATAIDTQLADGTFPEFGPVPSGPSSALNTYNWYFAARLHDLTKQYIDGPLAGSADLLQTVIRGVVAMRDLMFPNFDGSKPTGWVQYGWYVPEHLGFVFNMLLPFRRANPTATVDGVLVESIVQSVVDAVINDPRGPWTRRILTDSLNNLSGSNGVYRGFAEFILRMSVGDSVGCAEIIAIILTYYKKGAGFQRQFVEGASGGGWWNGLGLDGSASAHPTDGHQIDAIYGNGMMRASTQLATVTKGTSFTVSAIYEDIHALVLFLRRIPYKTVISDFFLERYFFSWKRIPASATYYIQDLIAGIGDDVDPNWVEIWRTTEAEFRRPRMDASLAGGQAWWQMLCVDFREPEYRISIKHGAVDVASNSLPIFGAQAQHWPFIQCAIVQTGANDATRENQGDQFVNSSIGLNYFGPNLSTRIASTDGMPTEARTGNHNSLNNFGSCMAQDYWGLIGSRKDRAQSADVTTNQKTHMWVRNDGSPSFLITLTAGISPKNGTSVPVSVQTHVQDLWLDDAAVNRGTGSGVEVVADGSTLDQVISTSENYSVFVNRLGYIFYGTYDIHERFFTRSRALRDMHQDYGQGEGTAQVYHISVDHGQSPQDASDEVLMVLKGTNGDVQTLRNNKPYQTIANTAEAQFVQVGQQLIGRFHEAGSVQAFGVEISVDRPCGLRILDNQDGTYDVSYVDDERIYTPAVRSLSLTINGTTQVLPFGAENNWYVSNGQEFQRLEYMPKPVYGYDFS